MCSAVVSRWPVQYSVIMKICLLYLGSPDSEPFQVNFIASQATFLLENSSSNITTVSLCCRATTSIELFSTCSSFVTASPGLQIFLFSSHRNCYSLHPLTPFSAHLLRFFLYFSLLFPIVVSTCVHFLSMSFVILVVCAYVLGSLFEDLPYTMISISV